MNFHTILLILHIISGGLCLVIGGINLFVKKQKGSHTKIGDFYHGSYVVVFLSSVGMAIIHWSESAYLFYIALFSYALALFGFLAAKIRWKEWLSMHIS